MISMKSVQMSVGSMVLVLLIAAGVGTPAAGDTKATPDASQAKISQEQAQKLALAKVPGTVKEAELEHESGKLVWSFDITKSGTGEVMDVEIDAQTGEILKIEKD